MFQNYTRNQKLGWILFVIYLAFLSYFLFLAESMGRTPGDSGVRSYNLIPFHEINRFWLYREHLGMQSVILNLAGNIFAFLPMGFFLPIVSKRSRRFPNAILMGLAFSLFCECTQLLFRIGSFDVGDLILNTSGTVLGYLLYRMVQRLRIKRRVYVKRQTEKTKG